ncbi:MAG: hypothetical protein PWP23_176 [Candidatus Sumerlaeota bacterium]|nr:hypothetical protein [Candidatus Sumerlaeota bacterium]
MRGLRSAEKRAKTLGLAGVAALLASSGLLLGSTAKEFAVGYGFAKAGRDLPLFRTSLFAGSGECAVCHSSDGEVLRDSQGNDLGIPKDWRATMMANAFKDPYFQAVIEHEVALRPTRQAEIEDLCLKCHAPMGRTQAYHDGATGYTLAEARQSALANEGVSCTLCHQIQPTNLGTEQSFDGGYIITDAREIYGPYDGVYEWAMVSGLNYRPAFGAHMLTSEHCATCHTLFTPVLDDEGNNVGRFPEQTPYLEWQNSVFAQAGDEAMTCQECHMPVLNEGIYISQDPPVAPRSPFFEHHFVGGNTFMLSMLRENIDALGVTADEEHFDLVIARTRAQLRERTAGLRLLEAEVSADTASVTLRIDNRTGHKFPTGYPSRRAWIHFKASDQMGNVLFESGAWNALGEISVPPQGYHPHYETIDTTEKVQVYEAIMGDRAGGQTTSLLSAAQYLKDNRLPPRGFVASHESYDDTAIAGAAALDGNFNVDGSGEGSGSDSVTYRFALGGVAKEDVRLEAELLYQSVSPNHIAGLAVSATLPAVDSFLTMYNGIENAPELVARVERNLVPTGSKWMVY